MLRNSKYFIDLITLKSEMAFREYSKSTQKTYIRIVEDFLNFTDKEAIYIRKEDIERYLDKNLKTVSTNTVLVQLNALEFFFVEILGLNITENIRKYKRIFKKKDFISMSEYNKLMASVSERSRLIYMIIKEVGFVAREIVSIKNTDIDYAKCTLKGFKISKELAKDLMKYADRQSSNNIFNFNECTLRHNNIRATTRILGKHYSFTDLSHSVALEMIKRGEEKRAVEYLRNKSLSGMRQYYRRAGYNYLKQDK